MCYRVASFFFFEHCGACHQMPHCTLRMEPDIETKHKLIGKDLALACARAADEIQAEDIRLWDMRGVSSITDYMIVCSGTSMPQLRAVLREVARVVTDEHGVRPVNKEGNPEARWVVLDFIDVMVHVMHTEMREFYDLEKLWADAVEVDWHTTEA